MVAPSCLQLASSWTHVGPRSGSPAAPEPTQALPNPFHVASEPPKPPFAPYKIQHRSQKATQTSNLDLPNHQLDAQNTPTWLQEAPSPAQTLRASSVRKHATVSVPKSSSWSGFDPTNQSNWIYQCRRQEVRWRSAQCFASRTQQGIIENYQCNKVCNWITWTQPQTWLLFEEVESKRCPDLCRVPPSFLLLCFWFAALLLVETSLKWQKYIVI